MFAEYSLSRQPQTRGAKEYLREGQGGITKHTAKHIYKLFLCIRIFIYLQTPYFFFMRTFLRLLVEAGAASGGHATRRLATVQDDPRPRTSASTSQSGGMSPSHPSPPSAAAQ